MRVFFKRLSGVVYGILKGKGDREQARAMWQGRVPLSRETLERFLKHPSWEVRNYAVKAIPRNPSPERVAILRERLLNPEEVGIVRRNCAEALAKIKPAEPESVEALVQALGDPYWEVRAESARALWCVASPSTELEEALIRAVEKERNFEVLCGLSQALGGLGVSERTFKALRKLSEHRNWLVRTQSAIGLSEFFFRHREKEPDVKRALLELDFQSDGIIARVVFQSCMDRLAEAIEREDVDEVRRLYLHLKNGWREGE